MGRRRVFRTLLFLRRRVGKVASIATQTEAAGKVAALGGADLVSGGRALLQRLVAAAVPPHLLRGRRWHVERRLRKLLGKLGDGVGVLLEPVLLHVVGLLVEHVLLVHELVVQLLRLMQLHRVELLLERQLLLLVHLLLHIVARLAAGVRVRVHVDGRERRRQETLASRR